MSRLNTEYSPVVTVDLDDTLIETSIDYQNALDNGAELISMWYDVPKDQVLDIISEVDNQRIEADDSQVHLDAFPSSFVETLEIVSEGRHTQEQAQMVDEIARKAYKSTQEYAQRGFMPGAAEMLKQLYAVTDKMFLVSSGVHTLQNRKVEALGLNSFFDEFYFTETLGKHDPLQSIKQQHKRPRQNMYHIGNSVSSDIESAIDVDLHAVYISDSLDWCSTNEHALEHENVVHASDNAMQFTNQLHDIIF